MASASPPSDRARIRRVPDNARYDRATIDAVLDAGLVAHVGLVGDDGHPYVLPMVYARDDDRVLVHGSAASRLMRDAAREVPVTVTVTLVDGIIVARSLFESSLRYRSVVVLGRARPITDPAEKSAALVTLSERLIPGRPAEVRPSTAKEEAATLVWSLPLDESSAKVGDGFSDDPAEDVAGDAWAGVVPLRMVAGAPVPAPDLRPGLPVPPSVRSLVDEAPPSP